MHTWKKVFGTICVIAGVGPTYALTITGQVMDSRAQPVEGAEVVVCGQQDAKMISPVVRTDAEGRFALDVDVTLDSDVTRQRDVFVVARKTGLAYAWEWLNVSINTVARKHFPLVLKPVCALEGQVVDADGRPVAGAEVQATPGPVLGPREWFTVTADPQGRFRFEGLATGGTAGFRVRAPGWGSLYVLFRHAVQQLGFGAGQSDVRLMLPREGEIKGRVQDGQGRPVSGVDLLIRSGRERDDITNLYIARKTQSDQTGTFAFKGIPEGPHCIEVLAPEQGPELWVGKATKVSVQAAGVAEAVVRVTKGGTLEVTALDARTRRPVPGAELSAFAKDWRQSRAAIAIADAQGLARMKVPGGTYIVGMGGDRFYAWVSTEQVVEGQTLRFEASLSSQPRVQGRVLDAGGQPAADVSVWMHFGDRMVTDRDGRFSGSFDEGSVGKGATIMARDPVHGLASVTVRNPSESVELRLGPAWTLVGKVADPNGAGIPAARVVLFLDVQKIGARLDEGVLTGSDGRFEIKAIPPVQNGFSYHISVNAAGFGPKEFKRIAPEGPAGTVVDIGTIDLPLADQTVSGIVVDASGAPLRGVFVSAHNELRDVDQPRGATVTDEKGQFCLTRECRGTIHVEAADPSGQESNGHVILQAPAQDVKIVMGRNVHHESKVSIQGRTLPNLAELFAGLPAAGDSNKPMLLCLVDLEQRPSKRCLSDLAKKAGTLSAKGVTVVVVQVSKTDLNQYQDWLKAAQIELPIHMAEGDFEAKKMAWGVKALPWLILADKEHVVVAEGFAISELDKHLEQVK